MQTESRRRSKLGIQWNYLQSETSFEYSTKSSIQRLYYHSQTNKFWQSIQQKMGLICRHHRQIELRYAHRNRNWTQIKMRRQELRLETRPIPIIVVVALSIYNAQSAFALQTSTRSQFAAVSKDNHSPGYRPHEKLYPCCYHPWETHPAPPSSLLKKRRNIKDVGLVCESRRPSLSFATMRRPSPTHATNPDDVATPRSAIQKPTCCPIQCNLY